MPKSKPAAVLALSALNFYQRFLGPFFGGECRFSPTCSEYARQCFLHYSFFTALGKSIWRLLRCHPFAEGYEDEPLTRPATQPITKDK